MSTRFSNTFRYIDRIPHFGQYLTMDPSFSSSSSSSSAKATDDHADPSFATTLAHGLDVLAAFRNRSGSLSNADLALHTGLSRPTVSRLTSTLGPLANCKKAP